MNNATYYHLYLDGELEHPAAALRRIAVGFHLDGVRLWDPAGRLITAAPGVTPEVPAPPPTGRPWAGVEWVAGQPWLAARQPIERAGNVIAVLWLGRPLSRVLAEVFPVGGEVAASVAGDVTIPRARRVEVAAAGAPVALDVMVVDRLGPALASVKRLLLWLLPMAGLILTGLLAWVLRRQLLPLATLTRAVAAVGRGEFAPVPPLQGRRGNDEVARLVDAYNAMTADLAKLRELERRMDQEQRLSAIGRMAARVAHDINNPLAVIRGVAELQEKQAERSGDGRRLEDARLIRHHIERCKRTVEQLLAYGRPVRLNPQVQDLNRLVGDMVVRWQRQNEKIPLVFRTAKAPLMAPVDAYQLERVLDNARDASPDGPVEVCLADRDGMAELRVRDAGAGFSDKARRHLFEPFHSTKRGGSGLGLASCLTILQAHGGTLTLGDGPGGELVARLPLAALTPSAPDGTPPLPR